MDRAGDQTGVSNNESSAGGTQNDGHSTTLVESRALAPRTKPSAYVFTLNNNEHHGCNNGSNRRRPVR
jgi:hypothetical protein